MSVRRAALQNTVYLDIVAANLVEFLQDGDTLVQDGDCFFLLGRGCNQRLAGDTLSFCWKQTQGFKNDKTQKKISSRINRLTPK